jgi:surface carbohydrate biosynthesis protein
MNLYLQIEILNRELESKLLIAMESASKGMKVYLGRLKPYLMRDFFVPGIILDKSLTPSKFKLSELENYKKKNFIIAGLDEEVGLVNDNPKDYIKMRYSKESLDLTDRVFTWGKYDYDNLSKKFPKYKKRFILSGNPRLDYWRKDFDFYHRQKKLEYKNYILFSLNYRLLSKDEFVKRSKWLKETNYVERGLTINRLNKMNKDSFRIHNKISKLIEALSKKTNLTIIVRPHPVDKLKNYDHLKKYKNVKIIKKGSISGWIYSAKLVIHSSCAGGLEASVRGKPTISFLPFNSVHGHKFSNKFSIKTKNIKQCLDIVKKLTDSNTKIKKPNLKSLRSRAYNFESEKPGYKIIAEEFSKLMKIDKIKKNNNELLLKFRFKIRDIRSKILNYEYGNIKFSIFDKHETLKMFEILKKLNPKYNDLSIDFIKKDIIYIKNKN